MGSSFSVIHDVNFRHLMTEYFLVCGGDYFCGNISEITGFDIETISNYRDVKMCSPCKCDRFCINRGDCCADIYFAKPVLQCVNRTIIQAREDTDRVQQNQRLMVASCPKGAPENVRKSCENSDVKSKLRHQPVVHYDQLVVYKNKFCANCNNVTLYREWAIDINCSKFADFNFLSSINDVISLAFERKCVIQSTDDNMFGTFRPAVSIQYNVENCISKPYQYAKCNVTGMWVNYDKDIEYACESPFLGEKRMFRNIFCFMCNPSPGKHDKFIDSCNVTGSWNPFDDGLLILCHNLPRSPYTAPFKNVFCFLCNRGQLGNKTFLDVNGDMEEFTVHCWIHSKIPV
ncbi:hypothetical protein FSP39_010714 [Pinctada imbricata]|uniref:Uncharacterized protein n=1 Tax=Pinctada imbricata TaxID=66713 RepID=A0AA88XN49_PINIB|nr:hypothetical protein FSP39_010714 [Pinctada imbricata]